MRVLLTVACLALGLLASGCASIVSGTTQTISFNSNPSGATCEVEREGSVIGSVTTPSGLVVEKTKHNLKVSCVKDGYQESIGMLESGTEGATFGNILLGGGIGWAIDSASGADNKYPETITVTLVPIVPDQAAAAAAMVRWAGQGGADACGASWSIDLVNEDGQLHGTLVRGDSHYDLSGSTGTDPTLGQGTAEPTGDDAAQALKFSVAFAPEVAKGEVTAGDADSACKTAVTLAKIAAETS